MRGLARLLVRVVGFTVIFAVFMGLMILGFNLGLSATFNVVAIVVLALLVVNLMAINADPGGGGIGLLSLAISGWFVMGFVSGLARMFLNGYFS